MNDLDKAFAATDEKTRAVLALDLVQMVEKAICDLPIRDVSSVLHLLQGMKIAAQDIIKNNE